MINIDGIDNGKIKHFLSFDSDGTGIIEIAEPVGFDGAEIQVKQENNRYGRDVLFAGGEAQFEFFSNTRFRNLTHQFEKLIEYDNTYGFESEVRYIIQYDGQDYIIGELDFEKKETDGIFYFRCKVIQDTVEARIKRHKGTNVDVYSDTKIDGTAITPLTPQGIVFKATPIRQSSEWFQPSSQVYDLFNGLNHISLTPGITSSAIENTLSPESFFQGNNPNKLQNAVFLDAVNTLDNVVVDLSDVTYSSTTPQSINLIWRKGTNFDTSDENIINFPQTATNYQESFSVGVLNRNERLWMYFVIINGNDNNPQTYTFSTCKIKATVTSTSIDSVVNTVRIIDVMNQVCDSIASAPVTAPEFETGGILYDQYLTSGTQLRNIYNRAFDFTFDDILKGIKEFDADYEVQKDGSIYFGTRDTFYKDDKLDTFTLKPNDAFAKAYNPKLTINTFNFKYDSYEKGQNAAQENSREGIHTEAQFSLPNLRVENKKEVSCPWSRDPFEIEKVRRQGLKVSDGTVQEDDESVFIIDVITGDGPISVTESFIFNHVISNTSVLEIINDGSFDWSVSGIQANDVVTLSGENPGSYLVGTVGNSSLQLTPVSPTPNPSFSGLTYSTISYNITATNLITARNEDFQLVDGSTEPEGFANMKFSISRNLRRFYGSYLKAACQFYPNGVLVNTLFRYNRDFTTQINSETQSITEGDNIDVSDLDAAILNTRITNTEVPCQFPRFMELSDNLRTRKGYIEITNNNGEVIKTHPSELSYDLKSKILSIKGEDRSN